MGTDHGEDADDWGAARGGDGEAYGRIFDRHRERVRRHAHRLVPVPADADDVVAVVFLETWRRRDAARLVDGSLLPWLLVTATNAARNITRSAHRHRRLLAALPPSVDAPDPADGFDDGPVSRAFRGLSLADRQVITLCVLEGYGEAEAAAVLGVARGTVKSRLSRAKRRLTAELDPTDLDQTLPEGARS